MEDATAQAEQVRSGACTPVELVEAAIARIEALNPKLNAVIHPCFEAALAEAASPELPAGPFRGVPLVFKDVECHFAGQPLHYGARFLKTRDWRAQSDTWLALKFREAGFVVVGRTSTPELGTSPTTEPLVYGPTRNPWNPDFSPGGSSGGSAVAVASGMVPAAHASDGGGSIRMPASACGLVGLKPTRGRISMGPKRAEGWGGLLSHGVLTRSARDTAAILDCIAGSETGDPYMAPPWPRPLRLEVGAAAGRLRIGLRTEAAGSRRQAHPDCALAAERTAQLLEDLGHHVEVAAPVALDDPEISTYYGVITCVTVAREVERWSQRLGESIDLGELEPWNRMLVEHGRATSATRYVEAVERLQSWSRELCSWWAGGFDLLLTPTLTHPPPEIGLISPELSPEEMAALREQFGWLTPPWNITGQPAISVPAHWDADDLPIGVQLVAASGREDLLVRVASQLERAQPWRQIQWDGSTER